MSRRRRRIRRKAHEPFITVASMEAAQAQIDKASRYLAGIPEGTERAVLNAMRRAMESARTAGTYKIFEVYDLFATYGDVRRSFCMTKRPSRKDLTAQLTSRGMNLPMYKFLYKPTRDTTGKRRRLVRVSVKRDGGLKPLGQGFVHQGGVYQRVGKTSYPINPVYGVSIPQMLGNKEVVNVVESTMVKVTEERLDHEIYRLLNGFEGKAKWRE